MFVGFASLLVVLSAVTFAVTFATARARLRDDIEADFAKAPDILRQHFAERSRRVEEDAKAWARNRQFASWLSDASARDVLGKRAEADLKRVHDGLGGLEIPRLQVTNDAGTLLSDPARPHAFGDDLTWSVPVQRALSGRVSLQLRGNRLVSASPVLVEGIVRGVLVEETDAEPERALASRILGGSDVAFTDAKTGDETVRTVERDGETWLTATIPIPGAADGDVVGWATLARPFSREVATQQGGLLRAIALATAVGLFIAILASFVLARSLAAPVATLTAATREIARGNYDHRVDEASNDELGQLAHSFNVMAAGLRDRVFFESALRRYLAAPVVEQLIEDPSRLRLGGERREVTVLFFDVAGFTSLAEKLSAEELVTLVNSYLDTLVEAIFRHHGTFDKFIGDAVMAFWGAPIATPDHATLACRAALDMQRAFRAFTSAHPSPHVRDLRARIGINSGVAALGNLGSSHVMSYTAMGDAVNVASRLEGLNKSFGTSILASETTLSLAKWDRAREVDMVRVVGRETPLRIYELADPLPPVAALAAYEAGLAHYRAGRFADAQRSFEEARVAGDGPCAAAMAERCASLRENPPREWDGVHQSKVK